MHCLSVLLGIRAALLRRTIRIDDWGHPMEEWLSKEFGHEFIPENYDNEKTLAMRLCSSGVRICR